MVDSKTHALTVWAQKSEEFSSKYLLLYKNLDERLKFMTTHKWYDSCCIDLRSVLGTIHPDYGNAMTWADLLEKGRRMNNNLALLDSNPDYYLNKLDKKIPSQYFIQIGSDTFIGADGNHRTAIGLTYLTKMNKTPLLYGVTLDSYEVDHSLHKAYIELLNISRQYNFSVSHTKNIMKREDSPGYMQDFYCHEIWVIGRNGQGMMVDHIGIDEIINESTSIFKRWTGKYKFLWA